ncbi:ty3-gypsy retrotransposon protein [Cucumis melo var. makuwa]|uniref:Ty3-gypsy retrotransposon protein n=1 Tax=Cucumis melo var. makuwa TaxID=1194695 RepID=A0A5A7TUF9_CUCMM|nr:ty3-gypsy retrotransposon protein [Cucumis melo var. makuwa]
MELSITSRGTRDFPVPEVRKGKKEMKGTEKVVKSTMKESMVVNTTRLMFSRSKEGRAEKKHNGSKIRQAADLAARIANSKVCEKKIELDMEEFGTFEPIVVQFRQEVATEDFQEKERSIEEDDEWWIIMTRQKKRKSTPTQKESRFYRNYRRGNKAQKNKKKKTQKPKLVHMEDKDFPRPQGLVTLANFFPTRFLCDHQDENPKVVACHAINATEEESIPPRSLEEEGVLKDLSRFNVDEFLSFHQETKTILINTFFNSAASSSSAPTATYESTPYCMSIDFSDEDLLLGSKLHNRPLYVSGYVREYRVDKILIDNGSTINIMPKSTMRQLGILMDELSNIKVTSALFHVIDSRTIYKLLLDRPWIHGNGVVTSILHQCFKFYQDGVKKVEVDSNPFLEAESHFVDAKFYLKNDNSPEAVPVEIHVVNRENNLQQKSLASWEPHKSTETFNSRKREASTSTTKCMILMDEKTSNPLILRYVPLSNCKKCESPFVESPQSLKVGDIEILKESFTTPLTKITKQEIKIYLTEPSLPQRRTKERFDSKAYKLMAKVGYDFITHTEFKSLKIHEQPELSSIQKKLLRKRHAILVSRKGLGYKLPEPICITRKGKEKVVDNNHITVEEVDSMEEKEGDNQRTSTFDRIRPTFRFGEEQFDGAAGKRLGRNYIHGGSWLNESEEAVEHEYEDSTGGDGEDKIADV